MSRLCCNWGARTCWRERFCDWCIPGPAMMCDGTLRSGRKASNYRADFPREIPPPLGEYDLLLEMRRQSPMKILLALIATSLFCVAAFGADQQSDHDQQQVAALAKEVQGQQTAIAE